MRSRLLSVALAVACLSASIASALEATAQSRPAADWLPASTVLYVESAPAQTFVDLPLGRQMVANALVQELWRSPGVMKARGGITLAEVALGERLPQVVLKAAAQGAVLAVDAETQGLALLAHTPDADTSEQLVAKLVQVAQSVGKNQRDKTKPEEIHYQGLVAYKLDQVLLMRLDEWLVVTNQAELSKRIADNYQDSAAASLATVESFKTQCEASRAGDQEQRLLWAWANVAELKARGAAKDLFKRPDDNFVAELVLGGVLATIREASTLSATLKCEGEQLRLGVTVPGAAAVRMPEYEYFFGEDGRGIAPHPVRLKHGLVSLAAYRDVAELWRRAGDLFGQSVNDQLAVADATLTTLFSGKDFGEDILGAIEPGVQIVAAEQDFSVGEAPQPNIRLPAFALIARLEKPREMQPQLRRIFMSLMGFINITGAMNQQPQLDVDTLREEDATYVSARYVMDEDRPADWAVPIQFNFSPTLAMFGNHVVLGSTSTIAHDIVQRLQSDNTGSNDTALPATAERSLPNTVLMLNAPPIAAALANNREQLISQNMLEKGHTHEEAANEIDTLLRWSKLFDALEVSVDVGIDVELHARLRLKP